MSSSCILWGYFPHKWITMFNDWTMHSFFSLKKYNLILLTVATTFGVWIKWNMQQQLCCLTHDPELMQFLFTIRPTAHLRFSCANGTQPRDWGVFKSQNYFTLCSWGVHSATPLHGWNPLTWNAHTDTGSEEIRLHKNNSYWFIVPRETRGVWMFVSVFFFNFLNTVCSFRFAHPGVTPPTLLKVWADMQVKCKRLVCETPWVPLGRITCPVSVRHSAPSPQTNSTSRLSHLSIHQSFLFSAGYLRGSVAMVTILAFGWIPRL